MSTENRRVGSSLERGRMAAWSMAVVFENGSTGLLNSRIPS
jgi:hypothetical protein